MARVERLYNEQAVAQRMDGSAGRRKRVAAYCRVSTDNEGQMSSLELQMAAFRTQIELRPDWELVDIYSDEGISGTRVEKRPEFQRMIRDCEAGKIDYIITKSISRFARNTLNACSISAICRALAYSCSLRRRTSTRVRPFRRCC